MFRTDLLVWLWERRPVILLFSFHVFPELSSVWILALLLLLGLLPTVFPQSINLVLEVLILRPHLCLRLHLF